MSAATFKQLLNEGGRASRRSSSGLLAISPLAPAGTLRLVEVLRVSWPPALMFVWVVFMLTQRFRFDYGIPTVAITWLGILVILFFPLRAFVVITIGVLKVIRNSVARLSAVVFWMYWPTLRFGLTVTSLLLAYSLGNHLWFTDFRLYEEYSRLQAYDHVDPWSTDGARIQDAGLVKFFAQAGVDRSRAGCIKNDHIYCIAPIVLGGEVDPSRPQSKTGHQDLFMAGIDCCNCPISDFRCGAWDNPEGAIGGMRHLDEQNKGMFRLAAEKWAVNYNKDPVQDAFFEWVSDPVASHREMWKRGAQLALLGGVGAVLGFFLVNVILNGIMRLLMDLAVAGPIDERSLLRPGNGDLPPSFVPQQYTAYLGQQEPYGLEADPKFVIL